MESTNKIDKYNAKNFNRPIEEEKYHENGERAHFSFLDDHLNQIPI